MDVIGATDSVGLGAAAIMQLVLHEAAGVEVSTTDWEMMEVTIIQCVNVVELG